MQAFDWLSVKQEVSPYLTRNITRINYFIHFAQRKPYIRFIQSQTELYWGCQVKTHPHHTYIVCYKFADCDSFKIREPQIKLRSYRLVALAIKQQYGWAFAHMALQICKIKTALEYAIFQLTSDHRRICQVYSILSCRIDEFFKIGQVIT